MVIFFGARMPLVTCKQDHLISQTFIAADLIPGGARNPQHKCGLQK